MASVNKVILLGNLGADPTVRYTQGGDAVANVNLATTEKWKNKAGEAQERTEWSRLIFFGRQAEVVGEYVKKGDPIYVEGRLQTRKWTDKDGVEKYTTEVVCDRMQMLGSRRDKGENGEQAGDAEAGRDYKNAKEGTGTTASTKPPRTDDFDDDIPF